MPPFIPDVNTLHAALKTDTLPASCAGALLDKPGDTLVKALQQVHALLHAFPQLSPSPSPAQSLSNGNLQSPICNLQSGNQQSDAPSVHPVHSPAPAQSEIPNPQSKGEDPVGLQDCNPQSDAPP